MKSFNIRNFINHRISKNQQNSVIDEKNSISSKVYFDNIIEIDFLGNRNEIMRKRKIIEFIAKELNLNYNIIRKHLL